MAEKTRLPREQWLEASLEILAHEGDVSMRVRTISQALGVSTGSFYRHFRDRDEFLRSLIHHWTRAYTNVFIEQLNQSPP